MTDPLTIAGTTLSSRLFVGTAGYPNQQVLLDCLELSGAEMVTVSIRRISLEGYAESLVDLLGGRYRLLPNTAGCVTARDAILTAELAREALETDWVKLELIGDRETLYPDVEQLVHAAGELVRGGFTVLPYCNEDPVACQKLADVGCAAVMPLGLADRLGWGHRQSRRDRADLRAQPGPGRARRRHRHRFGRGTRDGARLRRGLGQYRDRQIPRPAADGGGNARRRSKAGASPVSPGAFPSAASPSRRARNSASSAPEAWVGRRARPSPPDIAMPPGRVAQRFKAPV